MHTGFIYKIVADNTDKVYYGSTMQSLKKRMIAHRTKAKRKIENNYSSKELFNYPNTRIELLETHHHIDKDTLKQILREVECGYIERFRKYRPGRCVNKYLPNRTGKKYYVDTIDERKQYYVNNRDKIKEQTKQYRIDYADEIKKRKKQYYDNNANKLKEQMKQYRLAKRINKTYLNILYNVYIDNE